MISASSFWIRFADVLNCLALKDLESRSLALRSADAAEEAVVVAPAAGAVPPELEPADEDAFTEAILGLLCGVKK